MSGVDGVGSAGGAIGPAGGPAPSRNIVTPSVGAADTGDFSGSDIEPVGSSGNESMRGSGKIAAADLSNRNISTEDFLVLKTQTKDDPYAILDEVIAAMKENLKEVGEAIEAIKDMVGDTSKGSIALQLLKETFEAVDKMRKSE